MTKGWEGYKASGQWFILLVSDVPVRVVNNKTAALHFLTDKARLTQKEATDVRAYRDREFPEIGHKLVVTAWTTGNQPERAVIRILGPLESELKAHDAMRGAETKVQGEGG